MAEKKKQCEPTKSEENRQFLERTGVSDLVKDALAKIVANRPEDPLSFLTQYFDNVGETTHKVTRAYQLLMLTDHTRPTFQTNAATAYGVLSISASSISPSGLTGSSYRDLLNMICREIPQSIYDSFLKKIGPRGHEVIPYSVFYPGVVAAFILVDYYHQTQALFSLVCSQKGSENVIDQYLGETLITALTDSIHSTRSNNSVMLIEAGARFGNDDLSDEIIEAMNVCRRSNRPIMKHEEFLESAVNIYLQEVKQLR